MSNNTDSAVCALAIPPFLPIQKEIMRNRQLDRLARRAARLAPHHIVSLRLPGVFLVTGFLVCGAAAQAAASPLTLSVTPSAVTASGAGSGSTVIFFGVGLQPTGYETVPVKWAQSVTAAADGTASLSVSAGIPWKSIWVAVDLATGAYGVSSPPGFPARIAKSDTFGLKKSLAGDVTRLVRRRGIAEVLYVQPGAAAFTATVSDGSPSDDDGQADGAASLDVSKLSRLAGTASAHLHLDAGSLLFVLDPARLDVLILPLDTTALQAAE